MVQMPSDAMQKTARLSCQMILSLYESAMTKTLLRLLCRLFNPTYNNPAIVVALDVVLAKYHSKYKWDDPEVIERMVMQRVAVDYLKTLINTRAEIELAGWLRLVPEFEQALVELRARLSKHVF